MSRRPTIVCLTGSTRFAEEYAAANLRESLAGNIVLTVAGFMHRPEAHGGEEITAEQKEHLDALHLRKIAMSDELLVLNKGGYVGESTLSEIAYAYLHFKRIRWLEPPTETWAFEHVGALRENLRRHGVSADRLAYFERDITADLKRIRVEEPSGNDH